MRQNHPAVGERIPSWSARSEAEVDRAARRRASEVGACAVRGGGGNTTSSLHRRRGPMSIAATPQRRRCQTRPCSAGPGHAPTRTRQRPTARKSPTGSGRAARPRQRASSRASLLRGLGEHQVEDDDPERDARGCCERPREVRKSGVSHRGCPLGLAWFYRGFDLAKHRRKISVHLFPERKAAGAIRSSSSARGRVCTVGETTLCFAQGVYPLEIERAIHGLGTTTRRLGRPVERIRDSLARQRSYSLRAVP